MERIQGIRAASSTAAASQRRLDEMAAILEKTRRARAQAETRGEELSDECKRLQERLRTKRQRASQASGSVQGLRRQLETCQEEQRGLLGKLDGWRAKCTRVEGQLVEARSARKDMEERLPARIEQLETSLATAKHNNRKLKDTLRKHQDARSAVASILQNDAPEAPAPPPPPQSGDAEACPEDMSREQLLAEVQKLEQANADLVGQRNSHQRVKRHVAKCQEAFTLRQENKSLLGENRELKQKLLRIERAGRHERPWSKGSQDPRPRKRRRATREEQARQGGR